jgi:hypothetical protein
MTPTQLSTSLHELADAIEQLADLVASQKNADNYEPVKQLAVIKQKFSALSLNVPLNGGTWKDKYKKGYLRNWLSEKGLKAAQAQESLKGNQYLIDTAKYLAQNFDYLADFYQKLKYGQSLKRNFVFEANNKAFPYIKEWSRLLKQNKFIDHFADKSEGVFIDVAIMGEATGFINGYWLEIYLRATLSQILKAHPENVKSFDVLSQVHLLKPNGKISELDLLLMLNEKVYWFECKSGDVGQYYKLFNQHRGLLGLATGQSVAVIPDANVHMLGNFLTKSGIQCFDAQNLPQQINKLLF